MTTTTPGAIVKKVESITPDEKQEAVFQRAGIHFLIGDIEEENINNAIKWIVAENIDPPEGKILTLYINTTGGDLYQAMGLIDTMNISRLPIRTVGYGTVMSAGFLILASGTHGERYVTRNCGIMIHQMSATEEVGKYHDIKATRKETDRLNQAMYNVLKSTTGLDGRIIKTKLLPANDVYMTPEEMIAYGAADKILERV
jgi:ATP-dependent Clp protease, protease subunit